VPHAGSIDVLDVGYCEGWDPGGRAVVGALAPAVARGRDRAGEQYAVVLSAGGRPRVLIEVAWWQDYCAVWLFDDLLRRTARYEFRRLAADRMFLTETGEWRYESADQAEFDASAWTRTRQMSVEGQLMELVRPSGTRGEIRQAIGEVRAGEYWTPVPAFGAWAGLAVLDPGVAAPVVLNELPGPGAH